MKAIEVTAPRACDRRTYTTTIEEYRRISKMVSLRLVAAPISKKRNEAP